jgi:hypothetical protein
MNLIDRRIAAEVLPWHDSNVLGTQVLVDGNPTEGVVGGHKVVLAGTNNYLGLTFHPDCIRASAEAAARYGTGTTGSRLASGTYPDHAALEREIAEFYDARSAMVFTTGYQANVGLISALADRDTVLLLDAQSHAWLDKYPASILSVTGHTDLVGTPDYNQTLGLARAQVVQKYLLEKGIPPASIIADSKGKNQPKDDYITEERRAKNRRTEISIKMP